MEKIIWIIITIIEWNNNSNVYMNKNKTGWIIMEE